MPMDSMDYIPSDSRNKSFTLIDGLVLLGGFDPDSGISNLGDRDWKLYPAILQGDLMGNDTTHLTDIYDMDDADDRQDNVRHVISQICAPVSNTTLIDGFYIEGGWYIPDTKWEIDVRYDVYNRLTDDNDFSAGPNTGKSFEMKFTTLTLGAQYHINRKTRLNMEIANREAEAVDFGGGKGPNDNLDGVDQRFAVQLTHIF